MLILTDEQFAEGIFGGISTFIIRELFVKQYKKKKNLFIIVAISWSIFWFSRKIGVNIYKQIKHAYNIKEKKIELRLKNRSLKLNIQNFLLVIFTIAILKYIFIIRIVRMPKLKNLKMIDINLIAFWVLGFLWIYFS